MQDVYLQARPDRMLRIWSEGLVRVESYRPLPEEERKIILDPTDDRALLVPPGAFVLVTRSVSVELLFTGAVLWDLDEMKMYGDVQ